MDDGAILVGECSWRYCVIGIYKDRAQPVVRVYPVPFVRISWRYRR
jgi:hypothetical protein